MAQESPVSQQVTWKPAWPLLDPLQKFFGSKMIYLYLSAWKFGLYRFHKLLDTGEASRQIISKGAEGDGGCLMTLSHPIHCVLPMLLLLLWPRGAASSIHQALGSGMC